jgi:hypothetical protein
MSVVQLIGNGSISADGAAVVWWSLEHGASVMVAAGPQGAGKSTLATALLAFLPADAALYVTSGPRDTLDVPADNGPVYLLVNELSGHMPLYLSGRAAQRAFAMLGEGVRMVGTLHADSVEESIEVMRYDAGIPAEHIARVTMPVILRARWAGRTIERRVVEVGLLAAGGDDLDVSRVAAWDAGAGRLAATGAGMAALAAWAAVPAAAVERGLAARSEYLQELARQGVQTPAEVRSAILSFPTARGAGHVAP